MISKPQSKKTPRKKTTVRKAKTTKTVKQKAVKKEATNTAKIIPSVRPVPKPGHKLNEPIAVISRVSHKQYERERNLRILKRFLLSKRAGGCCEFPYCGSARNLQAAHIIERSVGGKDTAGNIIIACGNCHDHSKYPHGLPLPQEDVQLLVANLNREHSISNFLTGDLIPNGDEIND